MARPSAGLRLLALLLAAGAAAAARLVTGPNAAAASTLTAPGPDLGLAPGTLPPPLPFALAPAAAAVAPGPPDQQPTGADDPAYAAGAAADYSPQAGADYSINEFDDPAQGEGEAAPSGPGAPAVAAAAAAGDYAADYGSPSEAQLSASAAAAAAAAEAAQDGGGASGSDDYAAADGAEATAAPAAPAGAPAASATASASGGVFGGPAAAAGAGSDGAGDAASDEYYEPLDQEDEEASAAPGAAPTTAAAGAGAAAAATAAATADVAAGGGVPGFNSTSAAAGARALRIGAIVPLSGDKAATGRAVLAAVELAIRDRAADLLPGVPVELQAEDTKCDDVPALWGGQKLAKDGANVMIGEVCSSASLGALGVINKYQLPLVSPAATSPALTIEGDMFFRTVPSDRYQGMFDARQMLAEGVVNCVIASTSDSYGQELAYNFIAAYTRDGGRAHPIELPPGGDKNASAVVDAVREEGADGVFLATNDMQWSADVIKAVREANLTIGVTIFGGDSLMDGTVPALIGAAAAAGVRGSEVAPGSPEFQAAFQEFTAGRNISFVAKAAHAYDAAVALMEAFARAEEPKTGPQIAAALSKVKFAGESGPIEFDESGDLKFDQSNSTAYYTILEYFPDGSMGPEAKESWRP